MDSEAHAGGRLCGPLALDREQPAGLPATASQGIFGCLEEIVDLTRLLFGVFFGHTTMSACHSLFERYPEQISDMR